MRLAEENRRGLPMGLPCGSRTPRGRLRWYLVQVPEGQELATCERVKKILSAEVLEDAFVMQREFWLKRGERWWLQPKTLYRGYFFAASRDAVALSRELSRLSFPVRVVGAYGRSFMPLASEAQEWFSTSMDEGHVLRNSVAEIVDGVLHVTAGPLVGQESRVSKLDRHKRTCLVSVCDSDGGFSEVMPLDLVAKG